MINYDFMSKIDDNSRLAFYLNKVMGEMFLFRLVSAPSTFEFLKEHSKGTDMMMFYQSCLFEMWAHGVVKKVKEWQKITNEYLDEYEGNCRYYAAGKRLELLKEGYGDEEDYDVNGNPVERELTEKEYEEFSVISDLYLDDWRDIAQDTKPEHLTWLRSSLRLQAELDPVDMIKKSFGVEIQMYKDVRDEDGEIVDMMPMSREERELKSISESVEADDMYSFVILVCDALNKKCKELREMDRLADNVEEIRSLNSFCAKLLECKI